MFFVLGIIIVWRGIGAKETALYRQLSIPILFDACDCLRRKMD